jgi:hypothetical protein
VLFTLAQFDMMTLINLLSAKLVNVLFTLAQFDMMVLINLLSAIACLTG